MNASPLIHRFLPSLTQACRTAPALDLACGLGRNGRYLLAHGVPVVFADRDRQRLAQIEQQLQHEPLQAHKQLARTWQVDFELPASCPLDANSFGAITVFRYLHRPLMAGIKQALIPGGILIYETFTVEQARFGRPRNPDFLLREGELRDCFSDWTILHDFEGVERDEHGVQARAIAQLVAEKPF